MNSEEIKEKLFSIVKEACNDCTLENQQLYEMVDNYQNEIEELNDNVLSLKKQVVQLQMDQPLESHCYPITKPAPVAPTPKPLCVKYHVTKGFGFTNVFDTFDEALECFKESVQNQKNPKLECIYRHNKIKIERVEKKTIEEWNREEETK